MSPSLCKNDIEMKNPLSVSMGSKRVFLTFWAKFENKAVVHIWGGSERKSIYNVEKWCLRGTWVQYKTNYTFLGICTIVKKSSFLAINAFFIPSWTKFPKFVML